MGQAPNSRFRRLAGASVRVRSAGCGDSPAPAGSNRRSPPLGLHRPGSAGPIVPESRLPGRYRFALGLTPRAPRRLRFLVRQVGLSPTPPAWRRSPTPAILQRMRGRIGVAFRSFQSSSLKLYGAQRPALNGVAEAEQNRTRSTAWPSATRWSASFRCGATATPSRVQRPAPRRRRSVWACAGPRQVAPRRPSVGVGTRTSRREPPARFLLVPIDHASDANRAIASRSQRIASMRVGRRRWRKE